MSESINKVNKVCRNILKLTDEDIAEVRKMAEEQKQYIHPLKGKKQQTLNKTGQRNLEAINKIEELRKILKAEI